MWHPAQIRKVILIYLPFSSGWYFSRAKAGSSGNEFRPCLPSGKITGNEGAVQYSAGWMNLNWFCSFRVDVLLCSSPNNSCPLQKPYHSFVLAGQRDATSHHYQPFVWNNTTWSNDTTLKTWQLTKSTENIQKGGFLLEWEQCLTQHFH